MLADFIWNVDPVILNLGSLELRWVTLFLIAGILLSRFLLFRDLKSGEFTYADIASIFTYSFLGALIGSRLFYFLLFNPQSFVTSTRHIFLPFEWSGGLRFAGTAEFSFTGALIGFLVTVFIWSKVKGKTFGTLLHGGLLAFIVLVSLVDVGNFFHGDGYGVSTDASLGVQFVSRIEKKLMQTPCCAMRIPNGKNPLDKVVINKGTVLVHKARGYQPVIIYLFFSEGASEQLVNEFLIGDVKTALYELPDLVFEPGNEPLHYTIFEEGQGKYTARIQSIAIARHPIQLYKAIGFLLIGFGLRYLTQKGGSLKRSAPLILLIAILIVHLSLSFIANDRGLIIPKLLFSADQLACLVIGLLSIVTGWRQQEKTIA